MSVRIVPVAGTTHYAGTLLVQTYPAAATAPTSLVDAVHVVAADGTAVPVDIAQTSDGTYLDLELKPKSPLKGVYTISIAASADYSFFPDQFVSAAAAESTFDTESNPRLNRVSACTADAKGKLIFEFSEEMSAAGAESLSAVYDDGSSPGCTAVAGAGNGSAFETACTSLDASRKLRISSAAMTATSGAVAPGVETTVSFGPLITDCAYAYLPR